MSSRQFSVAAPESLPEDLRQWIEEKALVGLVFDAVQAVDQDRNNGQGARRLPVGAPRVMLTLLTYAYATGTYPSEEIEARLAVDLQLRYLAARTCQSGDQLRRFRRGHRDLLERSLSRLFQTAWQTQVCGSTSCDDATSPHLANAAMGQLKTRFDLAAERRINIAILADTIALDF